MSAAAAGFLQVSLLVALLAAVHRPFGDYMARVYSSPKHLGVEKALYRVAGVDPDAEQRWPVYARALLGFSLVSVLVLYALMRLQPVLPLALGLPAVPPDGAWNTAVSFVTNTNWQWYSGEAVMGHLIQIEVDLLVLFEGLLAQPLIGLRTHASGLLAGAFLRRRGHCRKVPGLVPSSLACPTTRRASPGAEPT